MIFTRTAALSTFAVLAVAGSAFAADPAVTLKKGDRLVFLGNSITQAGVGEKGYCTISITNAGLIRRTIL
jgi:hypothetical protein